MEEGALVWKRASLCVVSVKEGAPGVVEDATGKGRAAHMIRRRAPLVEEVGTPLALRGRLMPGRKERRLPPAAPVA